MTWTPPSSGSTRTQILALLRPAQSTDLRPARLGDSTKLRVGDWVVAIGNPLGLHHTVTAGIISAKARGLDDSGLEFLQTDAAINPGSSGGPLLDLNGAVVGLNTAILSTSTRGGSVGLNFAIPVETIKETLPGLRAGSVVHGWIGVETRGLSRLGARALGLDPPQGLLVTQVVADGPMARAGIAMGDMILGISEQPFVPARDVHRRVLRAAARHVASGTNLAPGRTARCPCRRRRSATLKDREAEAWTRA